MRAPNLSGAVKSRGVPLTGRISPVGIRVLSIGVKRSALTVSTWPSTSPLPCPARLKYVCVVKLTTVALVDRGRIVGDDELVGFGDGIDDAQRHGARIVLFAILEHIAHLDGRIIDLP